MAMMNRAKRLQFGYAFIGFLVGLIAVTLIIAILEIRQISGQNTNLLLNVRDCTEPGGECFRRSKEARLELTFNVNRVTLYATTCASKPKNAGNFIRIQTCVLNRLQTDKNEAKLEKRVSE